MDRIAGCFVYLTDKVRLVFTTYESKSPSGSFWAASRSANVLNTIRGEAIKPMKVTFLSAGSWYQMDGVLVFERDENFIVAIWAKQEDTLSWKLAKLVHQKFCEKYGHLVGSWDGDETLFDGAVDLYASAVRQVFTQPRGMPSEGPKDDFIVSDWVAQSMSAISRAARTGRVDDPMLRVLTLSKAAATGDKGAVDSIIRILEENKDNSQVRAFAASDLGESKDPRVIDILIPMLKDPDPRVRSSAVRGLANFREKRVIISLMGSLGDDHDLVRMHAATSLGVIGDREAKSALQVALSSEKNPKTREAMVQALKQLSA